jgi:hypothetical protein
LVYKFAECSDDYPAAGAARCQRPADLPAGCLVRDQEEMEDISQWRAPESIVPYCIAESEGSGPISRPTPLFPSVYFPNAEKWIRSGP